MASRRELERLEDDNRTLCRRLSDTEVELGRKDDILKAANARKMDLLNDLREYQQKVKDLKSQLERTEASELESKAMAHDSKLALEHCQTALRDQTAASKSSICSLQAEMKSLKLRLAEREEAWEGTVAELHRRETLLAGLQTERTRLDREGSSRLANLNQALLLAKQTSAQFSEERDSLVQSQLESARRFESLEMKYKALVNKPDAACAVCTERERRGACLSTPQRMPGTPIKPVPEETELDSLRIENAKTRNELQCLQANFQLTSIKCSEMKRSMKETERALTELQSAYDQVLGEKEELTEKFESAKLALANRGETEDAWRKRGAQLQHEHAALQSKLETLQQANLSLQNKLKTEIAHQLTGQDVIEELRAKLATTSNARRELESDLATAQSRLEEAQSELVSHQSATSGLSIAKQQSLSAIGAYKEKLARAAAEKTEVECLLDKAVQSADCLQSRVESLEQTNDSLRAAFARLEKKLKRTEMQSAEQSLQSAAEKNLRESLANLTDQFDSLSAEHRHLQEAHSRTEARIQELSRAKNKSVREASHHRELAKKMQKELESHEITAASTVGELEEKQSACARLSCEIEELKLELSSTVNSKKMFEMEVSKLMGKLEELERCNFEVTSKLNDMQSQSDAATFSQSQSQTKLVDAETKLQATMADLLNRESQVVTLRLSGELMEQENSTLLSQVNSLSEMVAARNTKIEALQGQIALYELEIQDITSQVAALEANHGQCTTTKMQLESDIETIREKLEEAKSYHKETKQSILSLRLEVGQLQEYNSSLESVNAGLQEKVKVQIARNEAVVSSTENTERSLSDMRRMLDAKSASLKAALDDVEFIKQSSEDVQAGLQAERDSLEARCRDLEDSYEASRREMAIMESRVNQLRTEIEEQQCLCSSKESERRRMEEKCEQACTEVALLKDEVHSARQELASAKSEASDQRTLVARMSQENSLVHNELEQFEHVRESCLSLLERSDPHSTEHSPVSVTTKKQLKGILKSSSKSGGILRPIQNTM